MIVFLLLSERLLVGIVNKPLVRFTGVAHGIAQRVGIEFVRGN